MATYEGLIQFAMLIVEIIGLVVMIMNSSNNKKK